MHCRKYLPYFNGETYIYVTRPRKIMQDSEIKPINSLFAEKGKVTGRKYFGLTGQTETRNAPVSHF